MAQHFPTAEKIRSIDIRCCACVSPNLLGPIPDTRYTIVSFGKGTREQASQDGKLPQPQRIQQIGTLSENVAYNCAVATCTITKKI